MEIILDIILDALIDSLKILPFLFVTYLIMEYLEHKAEDFSANIVERPEHFGPLWGGLLGAVPQCGFSAAASNLYAGRVITLGTLIAIYLSTSDEMIPLFISERVPLPIMIKILVIKAVIGILAGFVIDAVVHYHHSLRGRALNDPIKIEELCEKEHCHCDDDEDGGFLSIARSALVHTVHIFIFVLIPFVPGNNIHWKIHDSFKPKRSPNPKIKKIDHKNRSVYYCKRKVHPVYFCC